MSIGKEGRNVFSGRTPTSESSSQTAISCFFNKRKRNVIVLFVSTFKNTTLLLILESTWSYERWGGGKKEECEDLPSQEQDGGGKRMGGIFKKVLNSPTSPPCTPRREDKEALTLYFIREYSMSSEIWKVS